MAHNDETARPSDYTTNSNSTTNSNTNMIVTIRINEHTFPMPLEEAERLFGEYHQNIQDRYNFDFPCNINYSTAYSLLKVIQGLKSEYASELYVTKELESIIEKMKKDGHDVASLLVFLDKHLPDVCDQFGIVDFLMDKIPDVVGSEANQVIENYIFQNGEFMLGEQTPKNCVTIIYEHKKKIYSYGVLMTTSSLKNDKKTISFKDEDFVRPPPKPHELFNMASELLHTFDSCNISLIEITRPRTVFILASVFKKIGPQMDLIRGARAFEIFKLDMGIPWKNYATKVDKMDVDDDIKKFFKKFVELASDKRKKVWFEEMVNHIFPKEQENDDDDEEEEEDNQPSYFSMPSEIVNKKRPFQSDSTQQTKKQK